MSHTFEMRNVAEDMVDMHIDACIKNSDMCLCQRCRADVRAYALNHFPARYVVTDFGDLMSRVMALSNQYQADIITSIMQGILVVRDNPRHKDEDIIAAEQLGERPTAVRRVVDDAPTDENLAEVIALMGELCEPDNGA